MLDVASGREFIAHGHTLPGVLDAFTFVAPNNAFSRDDLPTLGWPDKKRLAYC